MRPDVITVFKIQITKFWVATPSNFEGIVNISEETPAGISRKCTRRQKFPSELIYVR
jgi:hypothetical protein